MGIAEAKRYIRELHEKQADPFLWPDFLTGLPGKAAIISRLEEIFPELGRYAVAYVRIANIQPYIIKYGPEKHADIIQWAAAILKTSCEKCRKCFVGTLSTHDFIVVCEAKEILKHIKEASVLFRRKMQTYYREEDIKKKSVLSFRSDGGRVTIGLVKLVSVIADGKVTVPRGDLVQTMGRLCDRAEREGNEVVYIPEALQAGGKK
jgi:GGDEF domain-containing protein